MKTRTSQAGTSASQAGYTLLEVLVVCALIALTTSMVPRFFGAMIPKYEVENFARQVEGQLKVLRGRARSEGRLHRVVIDGEENRLVFSTGAHLALDSVSVGFLSASSPWTTPGADRIEFMPNGRATGGALALSKNGYTAVVDVHWLTGTVSVRSAAGDDA